MPYSYALPLILTFSVGSLFVAWFLARWVLKRDTGTEAMREISNAIKEGAQAFLRRQNTTIGLMAVLLAAVIFVLYAFVRSHHSFDPVPTALKLAFWTTLSFVLGAACSVFAGYVGMWISIRSNIRTASAARTSLNDALRTALRGGAELVGGYSPGWNLLVALGGALAVVAFTAFAAATHSATLAVLLGLLLVTFVGFAIFNDNPLGGEPIAVASENPGGVSRAMRASPTCSANGAARCGWSVTRSRSILCAKPTGSQCVLSAPTARRRSASVMCR